MRIITDSRHRHVAMMSCEACMCDTRVSTLSPVFNELVATFAALHSSCQSTGGPDFNTILNELEENGPAMTRSGFPVGLEALVRMSDPEATVDVSDLMAPTMAQDHMPVDITDRRIERRNRTA